MSQLRYVNKQMMVEDSGDPRFKQDQSRTFFTIFDDEGQRATWRFPWHDEPEHRFASPDWERTGTYPRPR